MDFVFKKPFKTFLFLKYLKCEFYLPLTVVLNGISCQRTFEKVFVKIDPNTQLHTIAQTNIFRYSNVRIHRSLIQLEESL